MNEIQVVWLEKNQKVLHIRFPESWTTDDFAQMQVKARELLQNSARRVDLLLDLRHNLTMPNDVMSLFSSLYSLEQGRVSGLLFITHTAFQRSLVEVIQRINAPLKRTVLLISTPDELSALIGDIGEE